MLCKIDPSLIRDARRILTLLCFASRPLTLPELIDGIAVETTEPTGLNKDCRLEDYNDIHDICPGFINLNVAARPTPTVQIAHFSVQEPTVQIAHFSVQEYLESDRIQHQKAEIFGLTSVIAHAEIAEICLIYLLEHNLSSLESRNSMLEEYPLADFAAMYWHVHYKSMANPASKLDTLISRLFQQKELFMTWVTLHRVDGEIVYDKASSKVPSPVYYASFLGLDQVLHELLDTKLQEGTSIDSLLCTWVINVSIEINAQGGQFGNALQAASCGGHEKMVQLLLDKGADVNAQGGRLGNALQSAIVGGHEEVVQQLLDKGADIHAQNEVYGSALSAASGKGYEKVVQQLLDKGADVNAPGKWFGNALYSASNKGHEKVVQLLLDTGADVNARGDGYSGTALHAASGKGYEKVVQQLLDKGADVDAQSGRYGNALHAASGKGYEKVVQQLLDKGADVNAQGGEYSNALQAASRGGHEKLVQQLLDKGADVNAQGGKFGNAIKAASMYRHEKVVQLLLDKGSVQPQLRRVGLERTVIAPPAPKYHTVSNPPWESFKPGLIGQRFLGTKRTKNFYSLAYLASKKLVHSPLVCRNVFLRYTRCYNVYVQPSLSTKHYRAIEVAG